MSISYDPIGIFSCSNEHPYGAPRQGVLASESTGKILIDPKIPIECLKDLESFDRIWIIYDFHKNSNWKPMVRPPRGSLVKRGLFSTRTPYRPNSIGMSCVRLNKVLGHEIHISEHDILNGSPVLDIKPYVTYADSFESASLGWIESEPCFEVTLNPSIKANIEWLESRLNLDLLDTLRNQLQFQPTSSKAKRVKKAEDGYVFSIRAWRFFFSVHNDQVEIHSVRSGYGQDELTSGKLEAQEQTLHESFIEKFPIR